MPNRSILPLGRETFGERSLSVGVYRLHLTFMMQGHEKASIKRNKFTAQEDEEILRLVRTFGRDNWDAIARAFGTSRSKRQLRERFKNYLDSQFDLGYTEAEDELLVRLSSEHGRHWAKIAQIMGNKSAVLVRNRCHTLRTLKKRGLQPDYRLVPPPATMKSDTTATIFEFDAVLPDSFMDGDSLSEWDFT
jgi:hypothetical protein